MRRSIRRVLIGLATASLLAGATMVAPAAAVEDGQTYLIVYKSLGVPSSAASSIAKAGGRLLVAYGPIGVAVATSADPAFTTKMARDSKVDLAAPTGGTGVQIVDEIVVVDPAELAGDATAGPWGDPLSSRQWDMRQIKVPEAYAISGGSPSVVVGDIDTGLDYTHPDLAANVDFTRSVSCVGGVPNTDPAAWMDDNGHGTHTAGTIAAAANGIGIVGVAPDVKIAGIKAGNADGYFFPEAVVCAFMWAADRGIAITNNSYFADPWAYNCKNDPQQRAIFKAEQRAIRYAQSKGVLVVASEGNENQDMSKTLIDAISPDTDPDPVPREVTNACAKVPVEVPGVIGVTADGAFLQKSYYSSYGVSTANVVAPGGDRRFQDPGDGSRGYVLSTFPGNRYALAQGTSMAAPHVAGVAALFLSTHPGATRGALAAALASTADPVACPPNPFDPGGAGTWLATCVGGEGYNGFYGHGQVNALSAVTK